jgi:hypothetical protein
MIYCHLLYGSMESLAGLDKTKLDFGKAFDPVV